MPAEARWTVEVRHRPHGFHGRQQETAIGTQDLENVLHTIGQHKSLHCPDERACALQLRETTACSCAKCVSPGHCGLAGEEDQEA